MDNKWSIDETKRLFDLAARATDSEGERQIRQQRQELLLLAAQAV